MTADALRELEARYQQAAAEAEGHRAWRNHAVREAIGEGWTHQQVADVTGLTRGRISQIVTSQPKTSSQQP